MKAIFYVTCAFLLGLVAATMIPTGGSDSDLPTMVATGMETSTGSRSADGQPSGVPAAPGLFAGDGADARPISGVEPAAESHDPEADQTVVPASFDRPLGTERSDE
jgi:hypothetical protein